MWMNVVAHCVVYRADSAGSQGLAHDFDLGRTAGGATGEHRTAVASTFSALVGHRCLSRLLLPHTDGVITQVRRYAPASLP
ncbi:hypothetical protein FBY34_6768 [Streptomyces sp. SLBN-115]|nr:hypothetical protein FBY34_6768 [Streptomyces sp. SLBN-115]